MRILRRVPTVALRAPLVALAGGAHRVVVDGASVGEALRDLERRHPDLRGWVLDEQGRVREHVNVFVDGEAGDAATPVPAGGTVHVLSAISGG